MIFKKKDLLLFDYSLLKWEGLSSEQKMVYEYLKTSDVVTYKALGEKFGFHQRKIAYLMKVNPFAYVIPCHRVIAKNSLGGYKFSIELKKELLDFEKNT
ncbi:MAG: MGMT family protein [Desulfurella sp.]|uniref:MGMT family protein n=1 Tax=Desulfurella sp. TaxID=1962857 RepID=UPI003C9381CF